jgi:FtsP/CotA-like multicopper oxidase with cupredoxin domain
MQKEHTAFFRGPIWITAPSDRNFSSMRLNRRCFLSSAAAILVPFSTRAAAQNTSDGFRVLTADKIEIALGPAAAQKTLACGFAAQVPGPLLRYKKGEEIKIRLVNGLDQPVTFSCQGLRIANPMDGVAGLTQSPVLPGQSFDYRFTPPDSGFYWYRSGVLASALAQLDQGLYGPLIVDEDQPPPVDRDMTVVLAEWHLDEDGQLLIERADPASPPAAPRGHYVVTVNSNPSPIATEIAPGARMRLRLLSMVQSQLVFITFAGLQPSVIGIDGQPCEAFEPLRRTLPIGPGACFDVICDLPNDADAQATIAWRTGERTDRPLLTVTTHGPQRPVLPPLGPIAPNKALPTNIRLQESHKADLVVEAMPDKGPGKDAFATPPPDRHGALTLNGAAAQNFAATPLFSVKRGMPVTLGFVNKTTILLQMHVHGHALRLLHDLDDGWEPYWRSRVIVPEGRTKHVAFIADNPGKWAIECQTLELPPGFLASWFEVI